MAEMGSTTGYLDAMLMESALLARACVPRTACGTTSPRPLPYRMARTHASCPVGSVRPVVWHVRHGPCRVPPSSAVVFSMGRAGTPDAPYRGGGCKPGRVRRSGLPMAAPSACGGAVPAGFRAWRTWGCGGAGGSPAVGRAWFCRPARGGGRGARCGRVPCPSALFFVWPGFQCRRRAGVASSIPSVSMSLMASSYPSFQPSM